MNEYKVTPKVIRKERTASLYLENALQIIANFWEAEEKQWKKRLWPGTDPFSKFIYFKGMNFSQ